MLKFTTAEILSAHTSAHGTPALARTAHRADFSHHQVRPGYLYIRSRAISSRCNENFDEFPAEELEKSYKTFIGKPVFVNHVNHDTQRARGVVIDAALHRDRNPDGTPDTWVEVLMEVDGVRFPKLAKAILAKPPQVYETSMGCDVDYSICSACGNKATRPEEYCRHIPAAKGTAYSTTDHKTGARHTSPIREICYGLRFFENSLLVEPPADPTAQLLGVDASGLGKTAAGRDRQADVAAHMIEHHGVDPEPAERWRAAGMIDHRHRREHQLSFEEVADAGGAEHWHHHDVGDPAAWPGIENDWEHSPDASSGHLASRTARYTDTGPQCSRCHHQAGTGPGCPKCDVTKQLHDAIGDLDLGDDGHDMTWQYRDAGPTLHGTCRNCGRTTELGKPGMHGDNTTEPPCHSGMCPAVSEHRADDDEWKDLATGDLFARSLPRGRGLDSRPYTPEHVDRMPHLNQRRTAASTDGYIDCDQGHCHWGTDGAAGMLIHHGGHVLLGRRADWVQHGGTWGIPGGALHEGEGPEQGAHREATEELGDLPALNHTHTHHDDHGGWGYSTVIAEAPHRFDPTSGDGETDEFRWVHPRDFPHYDLHPGFAASWPHVAPHVHGGRRTAAKTAAYEDLTFEHSDADYGGTKWRTRRTVTAVHPEHGPVGTLTYYPPKRPGGTLAIDRVETQRDHRGNGVASALMDHIQRTHPGSRILHGDRTPDGEAWWAAYSDDAPKAWRAKGRTMAAHTAASDRCSHCGEAAHSGYCTMGRVRTTDWSKVPHFDEIHRGFPVHLGAEDHTAVHDPDRSPAEAGAHLLGVLRDHSDSLGSHWTTDQHFAHETAQEGWGNDLSSGWEDDEQPDDTHVVIHARFPDRHHIETDSDALHDGQVFGWNHRTPGDYPAEHEVPLKYGAPVHVTGISYKHPDADRWTHAHFGDDMTHTAALQLQAMPPRHTNPAEHPFFKEHPVSAENVVAHWADATPEEKAQGDRWYSDAHLLAHALAHTYAGGDTGKAAGVISAYSPRTSWAANMHNAARSLATGRALKVGEGLSIMGVHHQLADKIMNGEDYDKVLKGPKTNAFAKLIHHGGIDPATGHPMPHVVIDRHALSVAAGQRLSEDDAAGFPSSTPHYYNHVAKTYEDAANAISKTEGRTLAPHQVQAVTWLVRIRKNQAEDRELRGGGGKGRVKNQENQLNQWRELHPKLLPGGAGQNNMHMSNHHGARRRVKAMGDGSYRMMHQAPDEESGEPLHKVWGEDPDELRTMYRAVPRHITEINKGDWVTLHPEYAHQHALELEPGRRHGHVLQAQVPLRHLHTDHNDENEVGYTGPDLHNVDIHEHPDFPETMHSDEDEDEQEGTTNYAGGAVHLNAEDHAFVHNPAHPVAERAHRLMRSIPNKHDGPYSALGHAGYSTGYWDEDPDMAQIDAEERAEKLGDTGTHPATQYVLHSPEHDERTNGVSWAEHGPEKYFHEFTHHSWPASDVDEDTGLRKRAYGETKAPAQVDTLRDDACDVCGNKEGWDGQSCPVCLYMQVPENFRDPDTGVARTMDLRGVGDAAGQAALDQGADAIPGGLDQSGDQMPGGDPAQGQVPGGVAEGPGGEMEDPQDATADGEVRTLGDGDGTGDPAAQEAAGQTDVQVAGGEGEMSPAQLPPDAQDVLTCPACGYQTPAGAPVSSITDDPSIPASAGPVAGDVCPNCGKAILESSAEETGLTPPPEVAAIDPETADAQAAPPTPGEEPEQAPGDGAPDEDVPEEEDDDAPQAQGDDGAEDKPKSPKVKRVS